jgi:hypothetical protein
MMIVITRDGDGGNALVSEPLEGANNARARLVLGRQIIVEIPRDYHRFGFAFDGLVNDAFPRRQG